MNDDLMSRAVEGIDDGLILEAALPPKRHFHLSGVSALSAAACFMLVIGAFFLMRAPAEPVLTVYGRTVTEDPSRIESCEYTDTDGTRGEVASMSIPITLNGGDVSVSHGKLQVYSASDSTLLYEGDHYGGEGELDMTWIIYAPSEEKAYVLKCGSGGYSLILKYSKSEDGWTVQKSDAD